MFEAAEIGQSVSKEQYKEEAPRLRTELLRAQRQLAASPLAVVVILGGVEGAGKARTVDLLLEWLDARGVEVHAMWDPTDEERERPPMWRFWRVLPPRGRIGIFFGSWYTQPIIDRAFRRSGGAAFDRSLDRVVELERMLDAEDTLLIKLWLHLSPKAQRQRLRELADDPRQSWRVTRQDWKFTAKAKRFREVDEQALRRTGTERAPWTIVDATDARHRNLIVARTLLAALDERLADLKARPAAARVPDRPKPARTNLLSRLDYAQRLDEDDYERALPKLEAAIARGARRLHDQERSLLLVFEGPDAAGKGGAIRRLTAALDARNYQVISVAAPTDEERAHPYLWRFWRQLPRRGRITIFDRSWYGRVLVERIEGFCARADWQRAYAEINAFEEQLTEFGISIVKFWLMVSPAEQLRRFREREETPYKQYKLTAEDWRNREKWDAYVAAACEMIEKTSSPRAPWVAIPADDKNHARIEVLQAVRRTLRKKRG